MTSLDRRLAYLGIADFDYLAARLLLVHGLASVGLPKAAEAFEKILKLFLALEAKINRGEELGPRDLKKYNHQLPKLLAVVGERVGSPFSAEWVEYVTMLQDAYNRRYPEHWREFRVVADIRALDSAYTLLRNNVVANLPAEDQARARQFGTFLYAGFTPEVRELIARLGGKPPGDVLRQVNECFPSLEIDAARL